MNGRVAWSSTFRLTRVLLPDFPGPVPHSHPHSFSQDLFSPPPPAHPFAGYIKLTRSPSQSISYAYHSNCRSKVRTSSGRPRTPCPTERTLGSNPTSLCVPHTPLPTPKSCCRGECERELRATVKRSRCAVNIDAHPYLLQRPTGQRQATSQLV